MTKTTPVRSADRPAAPTFEAEDARSLDFVQRLVASSAIAVFIGSLAVVLAIYLGIGADALPDDSVLGLWIMSGVIGAVTTAAVLVLHRRRWYSPWLLIGLVPMAVSAFWVF